MRDARFGLPLSLVEALRSDPSPQAAELADLLADPPAVARAPHAAARPTRRAAAFALALLGAASLGAQAHAGGPSLEGRWTMTDSSTFQERVTGPAPLAAVMVVTRDDPAGLAYELVETRAGGETARAAYEVSFTGAGSTSRAAGGALEVVGVRDARGDVVVRAPAVGGFQGVIRVRRMGRDTAILDHAVEGPAGTTPLERLTFVRAADPTADGDEHAPSTVAGPLAGD